MKLRFSSVILHLSSFSLLLAICTANAQAQQWIIDGKQTQVLKLEVADPQAVYIDGSRQMIAPVTFTHSLSQTSGVLRIYGIDDEDYIEYFKELSVQNGLQFSSVQSATLFFGQSFNDGLLIGQSYIKQTGYGSRIDFETGTLTGSAGMKWHVTENPTEELGIVNKGYADGRYLLRTTGITTNRIIQAGNTLVISNGLITAIIP